jgi:transcriptional regulator with XRE-family HTH domain
MTDNILNNIIQIRNNKRFSQKNIADSIGISDATYSRIESGKIDLSYKQLTQIATFFEMSVIDVISYPDICSINSKKNIAKINFEIELPIDEFSQLEIKEKILDTLKSNRLNP